MPKILRILSVLCVALTLVNCSRDPQVVKKKYVESGDKYFDRAKYKEASIMYRRAINADPKFGLAYYKQAMTSMKLNQVANAVPALRRAVELLPKNSTEWNDGNLQYGEILLTAAQQSKVATQTQAMMTEANDIVKAFATANPSSYESLRLTGDYDYADAVLEARRGTAQSSAKQLLGDGISSYRKALTVKPGDFDVMLSLSRALLADGQIAESEQMYRSVIDKKPENLQSYIELYRIYMFQHKVPDGEALLKKAIALHPKDSTFQTLLAYHYFNNQNKPEGVKVLDLMKADLKSFPGAYFTAGDFYSRVRDFDTAIQQYKEGMEKDKAHKVDYQKHTIEVLVQQGKSAQAYELNADILKDNPKDPEARGLKGQFLLDKGDIDQAITELQAVVTARPDNFVARFQLGRAHYAKQEYAQASQQFEKAIQLKNDYLPARLALAQVALQRGDNDTALKVAQDALKVAPNSSAAKLIESAAMMRGQDFKGSRAGLEAVLAKTPNQPETLLELGVLDLMEKKYDDAITVFKKAYATDPSNLRGLLGQSEANLLRGKPEEAVRLIQDEVIKYPNRNDLKRNLADIHFRTGQFSQAAGEYEALLPTFKDNPKFQGDLYARIADSRIKLKQFPEAIAALRKAHELGPESVQITDALALLLENKGDHAEAKKLYEDSISRKADDPDALNNLAYLMADSGGNLDEALTLATRAKQKLPNLLEVSDTIGFIYLKKKLPDNAMDIFKEITTKAPANPTYHYHYAMAYLLKGDKSAAQRECQAALKGNPDKETEGKIRDLLTKSGA